MRISPVVASAEEWPEVPGARVVVIEEGGLLPRGFCRVLSRVVRPEWAIDLAWLVSHRGPSGLVGRCKGRHLDILLVAPMPSQAWCERAQDRALYGWARA